MRREPGRTPAETIRDCLEDCDVFAEGEDAVGVPFDHGEGLIVVDHCEDQDQEPVVTVQIDTLSTQTQFQLDRRAAQGLINALVEMVTHTMFHEGGDD